MAAKIKPESQMSEAIRDMREGIQRRELWLFLGLRDVRKHYNRSVIGPFWLTISMGMMVLGLGLLYSEIFGMDVSQYLPSLAVGLILWGVISGLITGACAVFSTAGHSLRQMRLPLSVYIYQFVWSQGLAFAHNFIIYVIAAVFFQIHVGFSILLFLPALVLLVLNGIFCTMILGPLCARYRDVPMIVASVMQIAFFMTPIIWSTAKMPQRAWLVDFNPFFHFIEIARSPLLGRTGTVENWSASVAFTICLGVVAFVFFARTRPRVAYWS